MSKLYATGKHALGLCDRCGFAYKLNTLRMEYCNGQPTGHRTCRTCWEQDACFEELNIGPDAEALHDPRSDARERSASRELVDQVDLSVLFVPDTTVVEVPPEPQ